MNSFVNYKQSKSIGLIEINNPPVNALSVNKSIPNDILDFIKDGEHDPTIKAFLVIGSGRSFSGGADITEFGKTQDKTKATLVDLIQYMDTVSKPVYSAITGPAMGGALELAMSCHYRLADKTAILGLPEVKLGILPGAGGTQRLPRIIGINKAFELILTGNFLNAHEALKLNLVDKLIDGNLLEGSLKYIKESLSKNVLIRRVCDMTISQKNLDTFFDNANNLIQKKYKGFPAPKKILECLKIATSNDFKKGIEFERHSFQELVKSSESKALRHLFFAEKKSGKVDGLEKNQPEYQIRNATVIGAGLMGGGIAMNFANAKIPVNIIDISEDALQKGLKRIKNNYQNTVSKGKLSKSDMDDRLSFITPTLEFSVVKDSDIVVEAVIEEMDVKKNIFKRIDGLKSDNCILATNTSTLDINEIASVTKNPESFVGLHFFSPANVMRLLEVVRGRLTSKKVLASSISLAKIIQKIPVCVGVCDGFVGNRMIHNYLREAAFLLEEGALPMQVDNVVESFGFAMGPFRMSDLAGLDIGWAIRKRKEATRNPKERYSSIADKICEMGRFGQKTSAGYYLYEPGNRFPKVEKKIEELIIEHSKKIGISRRIISEVEILNRLIYSLVNEAAKILDEGIASRASDIDVIYTNGYGFPKFHGGPMFYADSVGLESVLKSINEFSGFERCEHWEPADLLKSLVKENKRFNS